MKKRYWQAIHAHKATLVELCGFVALAVCFALLYLPIGIIVAGGSAVWLAQGLEVES